MEPSIFFSCTEAKTVNNQVACLCVCARRSRVWPVRYRRDVVHAAGVLSVHQSVPSHADSVPRGSVLGGRGCHDSYASYSGVSGGL